MITLDKKLDTMVIEALEIPMVVYMQWHNTPTLLMITNDKAVLSSVFSG